MPRAACMRDLPRAANESAHTFNFEIANCKFWMCNG